MLMGRGWILKSMVMISSPLARPMISTSYLTGSPRVAGRLWRQPPLDRCKKRAMVEGPRAQCDTRYRRAWRTDNAAAAGISLSLGREGLIRK